MLAIESPSFYCRNPHCGRTLKARASRERGFGPRCWARIQRAARYLLNDTDNRVAQKTGEILELGAFTPSQIVGVWLFPSQDGTRTYRASAAGCSCPAGVHGMWCCHRAAAWVLRMGH